MRKNASETSTVKSETGKQFFNIFRFTFDFSRFNKIISKNAIRNFVRITKFFGLLAHLHRMSKASLSLKPLSNY